MLLHWLTRSFSLLGSRLPQMWAFSLLVVSSTGFVPTSGLRTVAAEQLFETVNSEASQSEIAALIEGLASESYATRIRCRDRLSRIGLAAFDQLRQARKHPDSEVAIVARRLTSGLKVQWSAPDDSDAVQELLIEYGSRSLTERQSRISRLSELSRSESFEALLRLARFEPDPSLSRAAALAIMRQDTRHSLLEEIVLAPAPRLAPPSQLAPALRLGPTSTGGDLSPVQQSLKRIEEASTIQSQIKDRQPLANAWLLQYAEDLSTGKLSAKQWQAMLSQHRSAVSQTDSGPNGTAQQLLELIWITAERALHEGSTDKALSIVQQNVDLIPARTRDLIQATSWAMSHSLYPAVASMHKANLELYRRSPILLYSAAEAYSRMNEISKADALAKIALEINPLPLLVNGQVPNSQDPKQEAPSKSVHPQVIRANADAHNRIGAELAQRGLFRWAEKEFQLVIDRLPLDHSLSAQARLQSASMHSELQDYPAVIRMLTPLAKRIDRDNEFQERLIANQISAAVLQSDLDFHRGLLLIEEGEIDLAKSKLEQAYETNRDNIDILITMYRLEGGTQWKDSVRKTLIEQIGFLEADVNQETSQPRRPAPFRIPINSSTIAKSLNAYAWLVSNTEGDYQKALKYSRQSLKLTPNQPALMDTCARCYFAVGDYRSAVEMQSEACERMPHSPPLRRQLDEFKKALKLSQSD